MRPFRAPLRSFLPAILLAAPALVAPGCVGSSSQARGIALDDPLGLVMDVARAGNPLLELNLPNFIVTPHVAWASDEAMQALADQLIDNIEAFVRGRPQNLLT